MDESSQELWHGLRSVVGSKWAMHVVAALADEEHGFNELRREVGDVTAKTLSARLAELRCLGFVEKEVHATTPPTTSYRLTEYGHRLADVLADLESLVRVMDCTDTNCPDDDCPVEYCVTPADPAYCDC
ncbi:winged helix-turn-helix transcriptional regulator [Haloarchaeobius sp. DFWS5]|uniref:winged helix-turn-helix transcriptional regulator n=1 Tax=Haloarchaeobius sp. DFWS5 TaxID=3446114 RepID=UPI003EBC667C